MDNKDKQVLTKIHKHITAIISYCGCCTDFEDFQKDDMSVEACVFNLMQIGELAKTSLSSFHQSHGNRYMECGTVLSMAMMVSN